jgi:glycosyltransferase involved in cell wall biosynthesis
MENDQTLHKDYAERLNLFNEVWVPTRHGEQMFKSNGVRCNVIVMPLGVEISRYNSKAKPFNFGNVGSFRFISVFKWGLRKGYDILLKAYMEEFSSEEDVSLILVSRCDTDNNPNRIAEDFKAIRMGIDKPDSDLPHVSLYDKLIPEKDMPSIYRAGHAFVLISRGEGFGLPYYEASACGLPVIGSNCSGQSDLLKEHNSYLVEPDAYVKASVNGNLSRLAKHCHFYEDQIFPDFGPNAIAKTREHMRNVYENYNDALKKAALLQKYVRENCSWEHAVERVHQRLKEIV